MKVLLLGEARRLALSIAEKGYKITLDPGDRLCAVVSDVPACQFAPEGVPLIILGSGTVADWAVSQKRPDAVVVDADEKVLKKLAELVREEETKPGIFKKNKGALILTYSNKGGVGKTTAAASIALTLADSGIRTALCDFDLSGPDIAGFFNLKPKQGMEALAKGAGSLLIPAAENLYVLPGPVSADIPRFTGEELTTAVNELLEDFPVVVGDTPPAPWDKEFLHGLFASADLVYAVVDQSKFSVKETETYAPTLLVMGVSPGAIRIIVNRHNPKLASLHDIERSFCAGFKKGVRVLPKIAAVIPEGWEEQVKASWQGGILHKGEWLKIAREIAETAGCELEEKEKQKQRGLLGWLKR